MSCNGRRLEWSFVTVTHHQFFEFKAVTASNGKLSITVVPELGGKLVSLKDLRSDCELLRQAGSAEEYHTRPPLYGDPILFPPNRIEDGTFTFDGRTYQFEINKANEHNHNHGFVHTRAWDFVASEEDDVIKVRFDSMKYPDVLAQFPHAFVIEMEYRITGDKVEKKARITNNSDLAFPFGFGYHTTFNLPFNGGDLSNCSLTAPVSKEWILNERNLPTGEFRDASSRALTGFPILGHTYDTPYLVNGTEKNMVTLEDRDARLRVRYQVDQNFLHWVMFNGDGKQGFFCPEPYTWITNAPNVKLDRKVTGLQVLEPNESILIEADIVVERL